MKNARVVSVLLRIYGLQLLAFIMICLYFGQSLFIPFTIAILLTFILSPLVNWLEKYVGRFFAVIIAFFTLFFIAGIITLIMSKQLADLAVDLPKYKVNFENRLNSFDLSKDNPLTVVLNSFEKFKSHLPEQISNTSTNLSGKNNVKSIPVKVIESQADTITDLFKNVLIASIHALGFAGLVFLLLLFMLFTREDLRGRLIRLIGPTRITATSLAMHDAAHRVTYYLLTQLLINFIFGIIVGFGLFLIGIPNAILWGALAMILRFIPYLGVWIAAIFPLIISLAISPTWTMPLLTLILYIVLDLLTGNIVEPILFASNTGISSLALIVSAVFWTLLWGPIGLLLSTPLTVCIIVMGIHIPKLSFLHVLLSDKKGIAIYEEFYQQLIALDFTEAMNFINNYLKKNSLIELYDSTILPALSAAEMDRRNELLEEYQTILFYQNIQLILDDVFIQSIAVKKDSDVVNTAKKDYYILCIPASTERDEIASQMLMQILLNRSIRAAIFQKYDINLLLEFIEKEKFHAICISVVAPFILIPAKKLVRNIRQKFPDIKIILGLWGAEINPDIEETLKNAGVDYFAFSFAEVSEQIEKFSF